MNRSELGPAKEAAIKTSVGMVGEVTLHQRIDLKLARTRHLREAQIVERKGTFQLGRADGAEFGR